MNPFDSLINPKKRYSDSEVLAKTIGRLAGIFVSPWLILLVVAWQFPDTYFATLSYWNWFWVGFIIKSLAPTHNY